MGKEGIRGVARRNRRYGQGARSTATKKKTGPPTSPGFSCERVKSCGRHVSVTLALTARRFLLRPIPLLTGHCSLCRPMPAYEARTSIGRPLVRWEISGDAGEVGTCFTASKFSHSSPHLISLTPFARRLKHAQSAT